MPGDDEAPIQTAMQDPLQAEHVQRRPLLSASLSSGRSGCSFRGVVG